MDLRLLAVSYLESCERPTSGQQLVKKVSNAILMSQLSIKFEIPDDIELCMTLGKTKVTNII